MSPEDNKALARRWLDEVWNKGDLSLIDELNCPPTLWAILSRRPEPQPIEMHDKIR